MELPDRTERDHEGEELALLLLWLQRGNIEARITPEFTNDEMNEAFWNQISDGTRIAILAFLALTFLASAELHGATGDERRQAAGEAARRWAQRHAEWFGRVTADATRRMLDKLLERARGRQEAGNPLSRDEWERELERIFGRDRASVWASDLVTAAQTQGGEWAVGEYGEISAEDLWLTAQDEKVCAVCSPLDMQPRSVWGATFPEGPPCHVLCRCEIAYVNLPEST
jgi:hypothetical protein